MQLDKKGEILKNLVTFLIPLILGIFVIGFFSFSKSNAPKLVISPLPPSQFSLSSAPEQSLKGNVSFLGNVGWQSRIATQDSQLKNPTSIQQGESLITKDNGSASVNFPNNVSINISPKTEIDIIQALPINMVFNQASGSAVFENNGSSPLAVRSLALLTYENKGKIKIAVDTNLDTVKISVQSGLATVAFNDLNYASHTVSLSAGDTYFFYSDTREGEVL
jgi:hypothetical protein